MRPKPYKHNEHYDTEVAMIYGTLANWEKEKVFFPPAYSAALEFIREQDVLALEPGKYPIDGEDIFALLQDVVTEPADQRRFELHHEYIDIQFVLTGEEQQLFAPAPDPAPELTEDMLAERDLAFCVAPPRHNSLRLGPNEYAIYLPGELHCPCCAVAAPANVRKIVFKVRAAA